MDYKKIFLSLAVVLAIAETNAQTVTQDMGNNVKVTYDQSLTGPYKMTWSMKSRNGGSVTKTWGGQLQNGKRTGLWKGSATYTNFEMSEGLFWQGTSTIVRNYSNGKPSGPYSVTENSKCRNGHHNLILGVWEYGQWQDQSIKITGTFKDGIPIGSWSIINQKPKETITFTLTQNGLPDGVYSWNGSTRKFKNGYLIEETDMKEPTWGIKLRYTPEEIAAFTPEQAEKQPFIISNYAEWYLIGAQWEDEVVNYPQNSAEEPKTTGEYMVIDYESHKQFIGNPPEWAVEERKRNIESAAREKEDAKWGSIPDSCETYIMAAYKDFFYNASPRYIEYVYCSKLETKYPGLKDHKFSVGSKYSRNEWVSLYQRTLSGDKEFLNAQYERFLNKLYDQLKDTKLTQEEKEAYISNPNNYESYPQYQLKITSDLFPEPVIEPINAEDVAYFMVHHFVYIDPRTNAVGKTNRIKEATSVTKEDIQEWKNSFKGKSYKKITNHFEEGSYWKDLTLEQIYELCKNKKWFVKLCNSITL